MFKTLSARIMLLPRGRSRKNEGLFDDRKMYLLFACAHPRPLLSKMQVVIALKYVANLRGESLAKALGITVDGIDKILSRAKSLIRMENIFLKELTPQQLKTRLPIVHKIIYLIFNEGYRAGSGKEIIRMRTSVRRKPDLDKNVGKGRYCLQRRFGCIIFFALV